MLVDYLSPDLKAFELLSSGAQDFRNPIAIADKFLRDEQASYRVWLLASMANMESIRSDYASEGVNYSLAEAKIVSFLES